MEGNGINNFEQCMKCSVCNDFCPLAGVRGDYPGPKSAGPDGERLRLKDPSFFDDALKFCLNCKRCEVACPSDVRIGDIIQRARVNYDIHSPGLRDRILANTDFVGGMATPFAPIVNRVLQSGIARNALDSLFRVDKRRIFPTYSRQRFDSLFRREAASHQENFDRQVSYFHGCYVNYNFPKLGMDLVKILNAAGYGVNLLDRERCCGVAMIANGLYNKAKSNAIANVKAISDAKKAGRKVLTTSSTCTFTMREEYANVLGIDNCDVKESIITATRFIFEEIESGRMKLAFRPDFTKKIAYHTACHMERLGWAIYSVELMKMIPGVELHLLDSQCCGIAGTYGFKKENYDYSQKIGDGLFKQVAASGADMVATDCETCKWQIEMSCRIEVENPVSILADALDVEATVRLNGNKTE